MEVNVFPVVTAKAMAADHVNVVHVTNGCTALINFFGSRAPNTKLVMVVESIKRDDRGVTYLPSVPPILADKIAITPLMAVITRNALLSESGKGLVVGVVGVGVDVSALVIVVVSSSFVSLLLVLDVVSFRTPTTVHAVVKSVKKKPPTMTDANFRIYEK